MDIVLIRHAIAVERSSHIDDAQRPLTEQGRGRFAAAVRGLERLDLRLDHIFHSPWLRAAQTAELLAPISAGALEPTELLADDPGDELVALLQRFADTAAVAFVGHEPWMAELLSLLLTGATRHADSLPFKKGGVAWLAGTPRPGKIFLRSLFAPRTLRLLGERAAG